MVSAGSAAARTACCVVLVTVVSGLPYLNTLDAGFALGNVLLFACATAAAFVLARRLSGSRAVALAAALVWAVHPVHADTVASITGRAEILGALFVFGGLLAFVEGLAATGAARRWWFGGSGLSFAAALCSTEAAAAAVLLVPLIAWFHGNVRRPAGLMVVLAFVAVRAAVVGAPVNDDSAGPWGRAATAAVVSWQYVGLLTVPFGPLPGAAERVPAVVVASDPRLVIALVGLAGVVLLAAACRRYAPLVTLGIVFTATALAGVAALEHPVGATTPARLLFLPSFGWCLAAGSALTTWIGRPADPRRVAAAGVLLGLLALGTWTRNVDWRDDESLLTVTAQAPSPSPAGVCTTSCR
jgi:hypothetical protein